MNTTPEFTDAEIHEMMDFKQVLALTEAARQQNRKIVRGIVTTVLISGLVAGTWFAYQQYSPSESSASSQSPVSNTSPETVQPSAVLPDTTLQSVTPDRTEPAKKEPAKKPLVTDSKQPIEERKDETTSVTRVDSAKAVSVFLPAEPIDGYPALYEYFSKELRYPEQAIKDSIQGVTVVTFVINAQGTPEHVTTDHLLGGEFEKEAIRLIENMPAWKPAQLDGSPVRSKLSVPITFRIESTRKP